MNIVPLHPPRKDTSAILRDISRNIQNLAGILESDNEITDSEYLHHAAFILDRVSLRLEKRK